jgi:hypothetical protein
MKNRVHVGFAITELNKEELSLFEGSGKTMRRIKILHWKVLMRKRL